MPFGVPITLDGTKVTPLKYQYPLHHFSDRLYQHCFCFQRASQAKEALKTLSQVNIIAMHVQCSRRCRLLSFQTPYPLGPIMRGVLSHKLQPISAFFNRQPGTWQPYPLRQRVTQDQVALTVMVFLLFCGVRCLELPDESSFIVLLDFWGKVLAGLWLTILTALISSDVIGLVKSCGASRACRAMVRGLAETTIPISQDIEGNTTASLSVAQMVGLILRFGRIPLLCLVVNVILCALHGH